MRHLRGLFAALLIFGIAATEPAPSDAAPEGQMTWGVHISLAPTWFDPAETAGIGTPFMVLYALHDAMVKPMPGNAMAPSLAESWSLSRTASSTSSCFARARSSTTASPSPPTT